MVAPTQLTATTGDLARRLRRELDLALARAKVAGPAQAAAEAPQAIPPAAVDDVRGHLLPISGLLAHKSDGKGGLFAPIVRAARGFAKVLIRPWLDFQTRFNHQVIESLTRVVGYRRQAENIAAARGDRTDAALAELREQVFQLRAELSEQTTAHRQTATKLGEVSSALREAKAELSVALRQAEADADAARRQAKTDADAARQLQQALPDLFRQELAGVARAIEHRAAEYLHGQVSGRLEERVAEVARAADERLAAEVTAAVNRELSHEGVIAQAGLWFNPPVGVRLADARTPVVTAVTERILEHMFVHSRLPHPPARVLDMGCAESLCALELASMGYQVVGVDLRRLPMEHPNFTQVQANLGALPFPDGAFDVVVCLSTVEHVGLGWYTEGDTTTDLTAIREAVRTLRAGGTFLLTVPFGLPTITPVHRVYDRPQLDALLAPLTVREVKFGVRSGEVWSLTDDAEAAAAADSGPRVSAVALVVAEKE